jgi:O6-methylguanine-DNA--protein-cysteine methyltransferase
MAVNPIEAIRRKGAVRGRESRDKSLNTKLTTAELAAVEAVAEADGRAVGEWVREIVLKAARSSPADLGSEQLLTEIVGLQLFLTNALSAVVCGERMSTEQYQELMRNVRANKRRAARDAIAQFIAENKEEHHV